MDYQKVTFRLVDAEDFMADILVALLGNNGFESFEETTQGIIAYCPAPSFDETAMIENITSALPELKYAYRIETIADQNWNKTWEEHHFEPIEINNRCIIHSSRKPILKTVPYDIVINPQQAFGTGTHETTRMMLTYLLIMKLIINPFSIWGVALAYWLLWLHCEAQNILKRLILTRGHKKMQRKIYV